MMARWAYRILSLLLAPFLYRLLPLFSSKIAARRKGTLHAVSQLNAIPKPGGKRVWIHCASWGEFEMALPLVTALGQRENNPQFVFSFFSPSGFENAQLPDGGHKVYLADDHPSQVRRFQNAMKADLAVWVKYEFWLHHLEEIHRRKTPLWVWNASFRPSQFLFKAWAKPWLNAVSQAQAIAVQYESQLKLIRPYQPRAYCLGDARAYQTLERLKGISVEAEWLDWAQSRPTVVVGSSWPAEEELLAHFWKEMPELSERWNWIIVPHETNRQPEFTCHRLSHGIPSARENKVWVDQTGKLRGLYTVAQLAIVGGGFGSGLHNVYEPLTAGVPVICGPVTEKFPEAERFEKQGFLLQVDRRQWCVALCEWMVQPDSLMAKGTQAKQHLREQATAYSEKLTHFLSEN